MQAGESLTSIAESHGTTVAALARLNGLDPTGILIAGVTLQLPTAVPVASRTYVVRAGDSLTAIAQAQGTTVGAISALNRLDPQGVLQVGASLRLPAGKLESTVVRPLFRGRYRVQPGDTLSAIADRYGLSVQALARANRLDSNGLLLSGVDLRVPAGAAPQMTANAPYVVLTGDTLFGIAAKFSMPLGELTRVNLLDPSRVLLAGSTLQVRANAERPSSTHQEALVAIDRWADAYGIDRSLVRGLAWMESGFSQEIVSPAGAVGVMQVLPETWSFVELVLIGSSVPQTISGNVRVGVAYLNHLLGLFGGDERLALAAYYQGPASVRARGVLAESEDYVSDVLALRQRM